MTTKLSVAGTSEEVTSIAPKLSGTPNSAGKVKSVAEPVVVQRPPFLSSLKVLTAELRSKINERWEACWPINMLRPLVLLDLISYLLFIKKLEEKQLTAGEQTGTPVGGVAHTREKNELNWSTLKEMDVQSLHDLFTKEKGIPDLIKNYSYTNLPYSLFLKEPLLLAPTGKLLANMLDIIKIMEAEDNDTAAAIFEYLLNKAEIIGHNGQVYAPDYVVKLMVSLMDPTPEDMIGDPSTGNGSFFVNSAMYIANKNVDKSPNVKNDYVANIYKGIESDLTQLRIGAMNMILHGIENPKLEVLNVLSKTNINLREQPTLIMSNLFFESTEEKLANTSTDSRKPEIRFLNLILKGLKSGGRAAVILREALLYDNKTELKSIRQHIVDDHKLQAVISLHGKTGSVFSGACILIFTKQETDTTDKVWFYKMEGKEGIHKKNPDSINSAKNDVVDFTEEYKGVQDILTRWKNEKEEAGRKRTDKSFYVPFEEIRANNYNLTFNEYKNNTKEPDVYPGNKTSIPARESVVVNTSTKVADIIPKAVEIAPKAVEIVSKAVEITPKAVEIAPKAIDSVPQKAVDTLQQKVPGNTAQPVDGLAGKPAGYPLPETADNSLRKEANSYVQKIQFPVKVSIPFIRRRSTIFALLLVGCIAAAVFYFIQLRNKNATTVPATIRNVSAVEVTPGQPAAKQGTAKTPETGMLSSAQIKAILKDTTGILHFQAQPTNTSISKKDGGKKLAKAGSPNNLIGEKPQPVASGNILKIRYGVTDTTFFHDEPDASTRRKSYLDPLNKNILKPLDDRNGYIYIVYTNRFGRTSKGWINKKDLKPLK